MEGDTSAGQLSGQGRVEERAAQGRERRRIQDVEQGADAVMDDVAGVEFAERVDRFGAEAAEFVGDQLRVGLAFAGSDRESAVLGLRMAQQFGHPFRGMGRVGCQVD